MADHYHTIFRLPSELLRDVQRELEELHARKVSPQYCQRVSFDEYERQKNCTPVDHLQELLDSIAHDENVSAKIRKQRLKQVRYILHVQSSTEPSTLIHAWFNCFCVCFLCSLNRIIQIYIFKNSRHIRLMEGEREEEEREDCTGYQIIFKLISLTHKNRVLPCTVVT